MTSHTKRNALKIQLKRRGWTHAAAAAECGVTYETVNRVLNGHRESKRLIAKLRNLPAREVASAS